MVKKLASLLYGVCCLLLASCAASPEELREKIDFNDGWRFQLGDEPQAKEVGFSDADWRALDLPHDWAIEGDFSQDNPSGTGGGALPEASDGTVRLSFPIKPMRIRSSVSCSMGSI